MSEEKPKKEKKRSDCAAAIGPLWFIGWVFTIGFAKLSIWQSILAVIIWPYYLGAALSM